MIKYNALTHVTIHVLIFEKAFKNRDLSDLELGLFRSLNIKSNGVAGFPIFDFLLNSNKCSITIYA